MSTQKAPYTVPEITIISFGIEDVITTSPASGPIDDQGPLDPLSF